MTNHPSIIRWSEKTFGQVGYKDGAVKINTRIAAFISKDFWIEPNEIKFLRELADKAEAWLALPEEERKLHGMERS